jgi:hypothetical protein
MLIQGMTLSSGSLSNSGFHVLLPFCSAAASCMGGRCHSDERHLLVFGEPIDIREFERIRVLMGTIRLRNVVVVITGEVV